MLTQIARSSGVTASLPPTDQGTWGQGTPEGAHNAVPGQQYFDQLNGLLYIKQFGVEKVGWVLIGGGFVNVLAHGADPTGISDSSTSIQAAIDVAEVQLVPVIIPTGRYKVNTGLVIGNIKFIGEHGYSLLGPNNEFASGVVFVSGITDGVTDVIEVVGDDNGNVDGCEIGDFSIEGTGSERHGINFSGAGYINHLRLRDVTTRDIGQTGVKIGNDLGTTASNNNGIHYSNIERLKFFGCGKDGLAISSANISTVGTVIRDCYSNNSGRNGFYINGWGGFLMENCIENTSGRLEAGSAFNLRDVRTSTFIRLTAEGTGRTDSNGYSTKPTGFFAPGFLLDGCRHSTFVNCKGTQCAGDPSSPATSGLFHLRRSTADAYYSVVDSENNVFINCTASSYFNVAACSGALSAAGAGNLTNGLYKYRVTFVYSESGTWESPISASVPKSITVLDATTDGKISLTAIPLGTTLGGSVPTSRKIYRTAAGGSTYKLLATISDNTTTTYSDNTADGSLGASAVFDNHFYFDAHANNNHFINTIFTQLQVVTDAGIRNVFSDDFVDNAVSSAIGDNNYSPVVGTKTFTNISLSLGVDLSIGNNCTLTGLFAAGGSVSPGATWPFNTLYKSYLLGSDNATSGLRTDVTAKQMQIFAPHYTNAEEPLTVIRASSSSGGNTVEIGGGTSVGNATGEIQFYTASSSITTTGTARWVIRGDGHTRPNTDNANDWGGSANRWRFGYFRSVVANTVVKTVVAQTGGTIDWSAGDGQTRTLGADTTFAFSQAVAGQTLRIIITQGASAWVITWPTVKWRGGSTPVMTATAGKKDIFTFLYDGTDYLGSADQSY